MADTLNEVSWLNALFENWEVIDHCVVAFGLNIIGLLCITDETSKILLRHQESFKSFFAKLISNFSQLNASLRFATLKMLHKLCRSALGCFVMPNGIYHSWQKYFYGFKEFIYGLPPPLSFLADILTLAMQSLTDNSIFVVRAAKDLMIYLVSTSLVQHSGELQMMVDASSSEEDDVTRVFQFMLKGLQCVDTGPQSKRKATVILDILNEICSNVPEVLSKLPHTSQLNSEITKIMLQIDDYSVCSSSCNTLLNLNDWR